jgi:hypothetical protein
LDDNRSNRYLVRALEALTATSKTSDTAAAKPETTAATKQMFEEIGAKWSKFSEQDLSALTGNGGLLNQVVAKNGLEKAKARRDVDALLKGRRNLTLTANGRAEATSSDGLGRFYRPATAMEGDKNGCIAFR